MLQLFSHLLVSETHFDSYFYEFFVSHFDSYFLFHCMTFVNFVAILYVSCKLRFYAMSAFFQVFSVQLLNKFYCVLDTTLALYYQLLNTSWGNYCHPKQLGALHVLYDVTFIDSCQFILFSLNKLSSNLSKDQFREIIKYLEPFYIHQPNQPQTNNVREGGEEGEAIHVNEDYGNHPSQL